MAPRGRPRGALGGGRSASNSRRHAAVIWRGGAKSAPPGRHTSGINAPAGGAKNVGFRALVNAELAQLGYPVAGIASAEAWATLILVAGNDDCQYARHPGVVPRRRLKTQVFFADSTYESIHAPDLDDQGSLYLVGEGDPPLLGADLLPAQSCGTRVTREPSGPCFG